MSKIVAQLIATIATSKKGAKFASLTYRAQETGELARHTLILGASTETLYKKDIAILEALLAGDTLSALDREAAQSVLDSRRESLDKGIGNNDAYTNKDTYTYIDGLPGVFMHKETGVVYVNALAEDKVVIEAGTPKKPVKSAPLTIAKNAIRQTLPSARFRTFRLKNVNRAALNGDVLVAVDDYKAPVEA